MACVKQLVWKLHDADGGNIHRSVGAYRDAMYVWVTPAAPYVDMFAMNVKYSEIQWSDLCQSYIQVTQMTDSSNGRTDRQLPELRLSRPLIQALYIERSQPHPA